LGGVDGSGALQITCSIYRIPHLQFAWLGSFSFFLLLTIDLLIGTGQLLQVRVYEDLFLYHSGPAKKNHKSAFLLGALSSRNYL
jgi:hypothetical protein